VATAQVALFSRKVGKVIERGNVFVRREQRKILANIPIGDFCRKGPTFYNIFSFKFIRH
jgi:hypothetical protein